MGDVIPLGNVTRIDLPADRVLSAATGKLKRVVIMGWDLDGGEYFASSIADGADVLWLSERLKMRLMDVPEFVDGE